MSRPVHISKVIIEFSQYSLVILRDALNNYHKYLTDCLQFENYTPLSKAAIKRRIRYLEDFVEALETPNA